MYHRSWFWPVPFSHLFDGRKVGIRYRGGLRDIAGQDAYAETDIRRRIVVLDPDLKRRPREHRRILLHEYFHFVWVRLGNPRRLAWETHLKSEWNSRARGEAGWSAEWRKNALSNSDVEIRSRRWREYCCESFCDTAAFVYSGVDSEVTLAESRRRARAAWFQAQFEGRRFPI
jgi:hypothetical protein